MTIQKPWVLKSAAGYYEAGGFIRGDEQIWHSNHIEAAARFKNTGRANRCRLALKEKNGLDYECIKISQDA